MSVYTAVSEDALGQWLGHYAVGALAALEPIASGIENTNYFVTTSHGRYVLTLFERMPREELQFDLDLMAHLARHGIPCPAPVADDNDRYLSDLCGKPAVLVTRLAGTSNLRPDAAACAQLGALLARMHRAGASFTGYLDNPRGARWWRSTSRALEPHLDAARRALLAAEIEFQARHRAPDLPRGPVHADLFRDNVLFEAGRIGGVIDFYFAGVDCLLYDCAVCANDWCLADPESGFALDPARTAAFLGAYAAIRPFAAGEREAWPVQLRAAALRFWLSRLYDLHLPRPGALVHTHDPERFETILALRAGADSQPWLT